MPVSFENSAPVAEATSFTIAAGNTAQQVFPNFKRSYLLVQNNSDTDMWLEVGSTPVVGSSLKLVANGGGYVAESNFIPQGAVNIICEVSGKTFYAIQG